MDLSGSSDDVRRAVQRLEALLARFQSERQEYDYPLPTPLSHAVKHAVDQDRLRRYARNTICARIMQFLCLNHMKTQLFLETFLQSCASRNALGLFMAARSALEAYAVVWDTLRVVRENAGIEGPDFATRVQKVDEALIKATYGSRNTTFLEALPKMKLSRVRPWSNSDHAVFKADGVGPRIKRLARGSDYPDAEKDYELLCDYLHPNAGQNMILIWPSSMHQDWVRASVRSEQGLDTALRVSLTPMERAARGIREQFQNLAPPFGDGDSIVLPHHN